MRFICLLFLVVFLENVSAGNVWLKDLISPKGWDLGYGVNLKLNEIHKEQNLPIMDRLTLDLSLGELVGVSVGKAKSEGVELDFYVNKLMDYQEVTGRGKKEGNKYVIPMMIGYKAAILISGALAVMKILTMKAIFLAKVAIVISFIALLAKLKDRRPPEIIEVEQHDFQSHSPFYTGKDTGGIYHGISSGYGGGFEHLNYGKDSQASNVYHDIAYGPTSTGIVGVEPNTIFTSVTPNDSSVPINVARKEQDIERRRDNYFRKMKGATANGSMLIKKYASIKAENR